MFLILFFLFIIAVAMLVGSAFGLARMGKCPPGESHFICVREWLKAGAPVVTMGATFVAAAGGWIALQSLIEAQKAGFVRASDTERVQIAAIIQEKETFLQIYENQYIHRMMSRCRKWPQEKSTMPAKLQIEGLEALRKANYTWLASIYAVSPTVSDEVGKGRRLLSKNFGTLIEYIETCDGIMRDGDGSNKEEIQDKINSLIKFYDGQWKTEGDAYWDSLDKEITDRHAKITQLERRARE